MGYTYHSITYRRQKRSIPGSVARGSRRAAARPECQGTAPCTLPVGHGGSHSFVRPKLATLAARALAGPEWLHQIDGDRVQCHVWPGAVSLLTRTGRDWTRRFGGVPHAARALQAET